MVRSQPKLQWPRCMSKRNPRRKSKQNNKKYSPFPFPFNVKYLFVQMNILTSQELALVNGFPRKAAGWDAPALRTHRKDLCPEPTAQTVSRLPSVRPPPTGL